MNLEKLHNGDIYKNYKELCKAIDEPIRGGYAKQKQLNDWNICFNYIRQGNKYLIIKVYNHDIDIKHYDKRHNNGGNNTKLVKQAVDKRHNNGGNNTGIISDYLYDVIVSQLNEKNNEFNFTAKQLLTTYANILTDDLYRIYYDDSNDDISDADKQNKAFIKDFCGRVIKSLKRRIARVTGQIPECDAYQCYQMMFVDAAGKHSYELINNADEINEINKIKHRSEMQMLHIKTEDDLSNRRWFLYSRNDAFGNLHSNFINNLRTLCAADKRDYLDNCYPCYHLCAISRRRLKHLNNDKLQAAIKRFIESTLNRTLNATGKGGKVKKYINIPQNVIDICASLINIPDISQYENHLKPRVLSDAEALSRGLI